MESGVIGAGHRFATTRLDAQRSTAGWVKEQMGGISYLFFIRKLAQRVESEWENVKVGTPVTCTRCQVSFSQKGCPDLMSD